LGVNRAYPGPVRSTRFGWFSAIPRRSRLKETTMQFETREFGANVRGVNLLAANAGEIEQIKSRLYEHRAVIIKGQELTPAEFCDVAHRFGQPVPYLQSNYHHPEHPLIFVSSNVKREGQTMGVARTGGYWHSDTSFLQQPIPLTMLTPRIIPKLYRRRTDFIDLSEVYAALPAGLKNQINDALSVHSGRFRYKVREADAGLDICEILKIIDKTVAPAYHPAVITHPVTKTKILFVSSGFTVAITDASRNKLSGLRQELIDFAESGAFTKSVLWEEGDVIIWDNRYLLHKSGRYESASGDVLEQVEKEEDTMMFRISINDGYALSA
jgi:taurine dioxygenase